MSNKKKKSVKLILSEHEAIYVLSCLLAISAEDGLAAHPSSIHNRVRKVCESKEMSEGLKMAVGWAYSKTTLTNLGVPEESVIDQLIELIDG